MLRTNCIFSLSKLTRTRFQLVFFDELVYQEAQVQLLQGIRALTDYAEVKVELLLDVAEVKVELLLDVTHPPILLHMCTM